MRNWLLGLLLAGCLVELILVIQLQKSANALSQSLDRYIEAVDNFSNHLQAFDKVR